MILKNSAWQFETTGNPDVLQPVDIAMPEVLPGQVLLRVLASGFNPIDTKIRAGLAPIAADNHVPGCDVCGEVIEVGARVTQFVVGDLVYGCAGGVKGSSGTLCRYMAADAELLALAPASIRPEEAAALPLVSITAFDALERLNVTAGDELLIMGGTGGVGQMAVQLAKLKGANVTATAGSDVGMGFIETLGAKGIRHADVVNVQGGFNKVLDTHGGESFQAALLAAGPSAQVATINARNNYDLAQAHAKALTIHAVFMLLPLLTGTGRKAHGEFLAWLSKEVDSDRVRVPFVEELTSADVADVHRRYECGELKHKVVFKL
ncbi:MAG: zinc-binding dehydrogenase [Thalassolituus sp.]|uniref:alcohol dehydrogenase catalytic domain-containing protein n=1 Tax=Thalassolituus sp. TaxID=2030822 RepID=UPI003982AFE2